VCFFCVMLSFPISISSRPVVPLSLLALPNDTLLLVFECLSLSDLKSLWEAVYQSSTEKNCSSSSSHFIQHPHSQSILRLFNLCGGQLFHKFSLDSRTLKWLGDISVCVTKLQFQDSKFEKTWGSSCLEYLNVYKDYIKEMDFSHCARVLMDFHLNQIGHCPSLTSLSLSTCRHIHDLQKFLSLNPQLKRLNLCSTHGLRSTIIDSLVSSCRTLQHLNVSNSWFDDSCLLSLIGLSQLKSIQIHEGIGLRSVIEFCRANSSLRSITGLGSDIQILDPEEKTFLTKVVLQSVQNLDIAFQLSDLWGDLDLMNDLITQNNTCRQMIPPDLLPTLMNYFRKDREQYHSDLVLELCSQASSEQLVPVFSFLLSTLHEAGDNNDFEFSNALLSLENASTSNLEIPRAIQSMNLSDGLMSLLTKLRSLPSMVSSDHL
jgi:hypothetical protein